MQVSWATGVHAILKERIEILQFYKSDDVGVQTTTYSVAIRNGST